MNSDIEAYFDYKKEYEVLSNELKELNEKISGDEYLDIIDQLEQDLYRSEALRRFGDFVGMRNGLKAKDFDFDRFIHNAQLSLGMTLEDFFKSPKEPSLNMTNHISYFSNNNSNVKFYNKNIATKYIEREKKIASMLNLPKILNRNKYLKSILYEYYHNDQLFAEMFLEDTPELKSLINNVLEATGRTFYDFQGVRTNIIKGIYDWALDSYFKDIGFDNIYLSTTDENSITSNINLSTKYGREIFALQFPRFVEMMKSSKDNDYSALEENMSEELYDIYKSNKFLDKVQIVGFGGIDQVSLYNASNLTDNEIFELRRSFMKLPPAIQKLFFFSQIINNGFSHRKNTLSDILNPVFYKEVGQSLENLQSRISLIDFNNQDLIDYIASNIEIPQYVGKQKSSDGFDPKFRKKYKRFGSFQVAYVNKKHSGSNTEFLVTRIAPRGGYDSNTYNVIPDIEPIRNLTIEQLDQLKLNAERGTNLSITKRYPMGHNYKKGFYVTNLGQIVQVEKINPFDIKITPKSNVNEIYKAGTDKMQFREEIASILAKETQTQEDLERIAALEKKLDASISIRKFHTKAAQSIDRKAFKGLMERLTENYSFEVIEETNRSVEGTEFEELTAWVDSYGLHINYDRIQYDTPIHELQHIWNKYIEKANPDLWNRMNNLTTELIENNHPIVKAIYDNYARKGIFLEGARFTDEVMATVSGFASQNLIEQFLDQGFISPDTAALYDKISPLMEDILSTESNMFNLENPFDPEFFENAKLADIFRAFTLSALKGNLSFNLTDQQMEDIFTAYYGRKTDVNALRNSEGPNRVIDASVGFTQFSKINSINDFVPYINNNISSEVSFNKFTTEQTAKFLTQKALKNLRNGSYHLYYNGINYTFNGNYDKTQLEAEIIQKVIPEAQKRERDIKNNVVEFANHILRGKSPSEAGLEVFGDRIINQSIFDDIARHMGLSETVMEVLKYSDLAKSKNPNLKKLFDSKFVGYDPLIIVHNINEFGEVDFSLVDATTLPIGKRSMNVSGRHLTTAFQAASDFTDLGGSYSNSDGDIRKILMGMTLLKMKELGDIRIRNLDVLGITPVGMKSNPEIDIPSLFKNIEILSQQTILTDNIENAELKRLLTSEKSYLEDLQQSFVARLKHFLDTHRSDQKYKEATNLIFDKDVSMKELIEALDKLSKQIRQSYGDNLSEYYRDPEQRLISMAKYELRTHKKGFVNKLSDMDPIESQITTAGNLKSDVLQMLIASSQSAKSRIVDQFRKYRNEITNQVEKIIQNSTPGTVYFSDQGSKMFERFYKKQNIDGNQIILPEVYHTMDDVNKGLISKQDYEFINKMLDLIEENAIKHIMHTQNKTEQQASLQFKNNWKRGQVPVIEKSVNELILGKHKKDGMSKFIDQITNYDFLFSDNMTENRQTNRVVNMFDAQIAESDKRLLDAGLAYNQEGDLIVIDQSKNSKMSLNLENIMNYFILSSIRVREYESSTLPAYNDAKVIFNIIEEGGVSMKNTMRYADVYIDRLIHRKNQDPKTTVKMGKHEVRVSSIARGAMHAFSFTALAFRPIIGLKSAIFNEISLNTTSIANSVANFGITTGKRLNMPSNSNLNKAKLLMTTEFKKARALAYEFQLIEGTERDQLESRFLTHTNKNILTEQTGHILNWTTDSAARMVSMISWMLMEGSWDAYSYNPKSGEITYNPKNDKRYYNSDGTQSDQQKALFKGLKRRLEDESRDIKNSGHSFDEINNTFKWYSDKFVIGAFTEDARTINTSVWWGQLLGQFRTFSFDKLFNAGLYGRGRVVQGGTGYKAVQNENGEWISVKDQLFIEGVLQSMFGSIKELHKVKEMGLNEMWNQMEPVRRTNLVRAAINVTIASMIIAAIKTIDLPGDEERYRWLTSDLLILFSATEFFKNPVPMVSAVLSVADKVLDGKVNEVVSNVAIGKDIRKVSKFIEEREDDL